MAYADLTKEERAVWDEYQTLRQISDWPGFTDDQRKRKDAARAWLISQRSSIASAIKNGSKAVNTRLKRPQRLAFLSDNNLNSGAPKHEVRLPAPAVLTPVEKVMIEEREGYLAFASQNVAQKARKQANVDWLVNRRKQLYHLLNEHGDVAGRQKRYDALCVATHHGKVYETWDKTHNKWGVPYSTHADPSDTRDEILAWCKKYLGTNEHPSGSNKGNPEPSGWQKRVYGGDGVPWCACFSVCSAWDAGVVGSGTASVALNTQLAKRGQGIYRGFTTDPSKVREGDHFFIGSSHQGVVRSNSCTASNIPSYEGNTSPGSEGSDYNGGTVAEKDRAMVGRGGPVTGFGLIRA